MRMVWTIWKTWKGKLLVKTEQATAVTGSCSFSVGNVTLVWGMKMMMLWQGLQKSLKYDGGDRSE